jgi:hypothetical protein
VSSVESNVNLTRIHFHQRAALFVGATLLLGACGDPSAGSEASAAAPITNPVPTTPVAILDISTDVGAYPACGNEPFTHLGVTWYPVSRVGGQPIDGGLGRVLTELLAVEREQPPARNLAGFARVVPPGPGDDTGTLVVWADGVARWTSDSGKLDVWLVDDPLTYNWVC